MVCCGGITGSLRGRDEPRYFMSVSSVLASENKEQNYTLNY